MTSRYYYIPYQMQYQYCTFLAAYFFILTKKPENYLLDISSGHNICHLNLMTLTATRFYDYYILPDTNYYHALFLQFLHLHI